MNLNPDKVPSNLEEAVSLLKDALDEKEKSVIKNLSDTKLHILLKDALDEKEKSVIINLSVAKLHMSVGQHIRNEWSLWNKENVITQWFKKKYGVDHADDVSAIIIECVIADLLGRPREDKKLAEEFIEHWEAHKKKLNKKKDE